MKQIIILLTFLCCFASCDSEKVSKIDSLQKEITALKEQNQLLKDSLRTNVKIKLLNSQLIGSPLEKNMLVNKKNNIRVAFYEDWKLPSYDVYQIIENGDETTKKLLLKQQTKPHFEITFQPKSKKDNEIKLETVFNIDGNSLTIPAHMIFDLD